MHVSHMKLIGGTTFEKSAENSDGRTDGRTDRGDRIIRPFFQKGRIKTIFDDNSGSVNVRDDPDLKVAIPDISRPQ